MDDPVQISYSYLNEEILGLFVGVAVIGSIDAKYLRKNDYDTNIRYV